MAVARIVARIGVVVGVAVFRIRRGYLGDAVRDGLITVNSVCKV